MKYLHNLTIALVSSIIDIKDNLLYINRYQSKNYREKIIKQARII